MVLASTGYLLFTLVAVGQWLRVIGSFSDVFKELGIQIPSWTAVVLEPWFHLVIGFVLVVVIIMRHRQGMKEWLTAVWVVVLLIYLAMTHAGLSEPLIGIIRQLGEQSQVQ